MIQIAASHQAVRHALIAVGDLHRDWNATSLREPSYFSLQQCNKSIQLLRNQQMNIVQSLLACIIFAAFNMLQNQPHTALEHLESGLNIMRGWIKKQESRKLDDPISPDDYVIRQFFVRLFIAYEFVVGNPTRDKSYQPSVRLFARSIQNHPSMHDESRPFGTLLEACSIFHQHLDIIYYRMRTAIAQGESTRITDTITWGQQLLQNWHRKLLYYLNVIARTKSRTFNRASVFLRLQYNCSVIWLDTVAYKNEMLYDKYMPVFQNDSRIVLQYRRARQLQPRRTTTSISVFRVSNLSSHLICGTEMSRSKITQRGHGPHQGGPASRGHLGASRC